VHFFEAEPGQLTEFSNDLEAWADHVLRKYRVTSGYPLLHEWQEKNGALASGARLMPKIRLFSGVATVLKIYTRSQQ
jgi:hypothetical protein